MNTLQNQNIKNYNMLVEFATFLRQNGDKLFEKDSKLCLKSEQIYVLQEYLNQLVSNRTNSDDSKNTKRKNTIQNLNNNKEFILLYKSNQLHLIQDFLLKITSIKITSDSIQSTAKDYIKLNIFGSLTYLEIKNIPILNVYDLGNLRTQLENLITNRSINKLQDLLHLCGADQSSPLLWPKLNNLNISYNNLSSLDNSLRLTTSIENLDISHNNLKTCELFLHNLPKLKRLNISFNKLEQIPDLCETISQLEYLDISYNNIELLDSENLSKLNSLKHINLSHNIISTFTQVNHLRLLPNLKEILLDANPIKLNSNCDAIIKEILNVVKVKNNLKKSLQTSTPTWSNYQPRTSQPNIPIRKLSKKPSIKDLNDLKIGDNQVLSAPNANSLDSLMKQNKMKRRSTLFRLKPNNILIEQADEENSDFLIIKKNNESDSEQEANQLSSSLLSNFLQPDKLQNELEYYKTMRQKYGTGWLSVLPNEANEQTHKVKSGEKLHEIVKTEINLDKIHFNDSNLNIMETFLVYKTIDVNQIDQLLNTQTFDDEDTSVSILCLDERYLIEKDETNSKILAQYEYTNLSEILDLSKIKKFVQDSSDNDENKNRIKIKFKDLSSSRTYEFENNDELNSFIHCISEILLNKINLEKCDLYYCVWCKDFGKKSKFIFDDSNENLSNEEVHKLDDQQKNLTCTKCHKYLIKDSVLVSNQKSILTPRNSRETSPNRDQKVALTTSKNAKIDSDSNSLATTHEDTMSLSSLNHEIETNIDETIEQRVKNLLSNSNQISKVKLEEITNRAKKIKNNLKLYLIISILGEMKKQDGSNDQDENLLCAYRLKYSFYSVTKLCDDCLCVFTDRHLIIFQINDSNLFNESIEFEKCITKVACIDINQIEIIELANAQNYLVLNVVNTEDVKLLYKLVTNDVYLNQALLNTLLKTINESKKVTMLKQIKKKNEVTNRNLEEIVNLVDHISLGRDNEEFQIFSSRLNLFLYIEELQINGKNSVMEASNYENFSYEMFMYNNERILLVEENLSFVSTLNKNEQFILKDSARISDIVQLKLFKEDENRIEISIVDEANNSVQVNWIIRMNKTNQLTQFISLVKEIWEKIFFIELPISF